MSLRDFSARHHGAMEVDRNLSRLPRRSPRLGSGLDVDDPEKILVVMDFTGSHDWPRADLLALQALTSDRAVDAWSFRDDDPPVESRRLDIVPAPPDDSGGRSRFVTVTHVCVGRRHADSVKHGYVRGHPRRWEVGELYATEEHVDAALKRACAVAFSAHIYVTANPLALPSTMEDRWDANTLVLDPAQAASMLGRLLRERGTGYWTLPNMYVQEDHYYKFAVDDILPSFAEWAARAARHNRSALDHALSLRSRVAQVLMARDDLAGALSRPTSLREIDALDRVLLFCLAALDEAAHITNLSYDLSLSRRDTKWQVPQFRTALEDNEPTARLADLWRSGGRPQRASKVLRELRNRIHGSGFNTMWILTSESERQYELSAPLDSLGSDDRWLSAAEETASPGGWGMHVVADRVFLDAAELAEKATLETMWLLESTFAASPAPQFAGGAVSEPAEDHEIDWLSPGIPVAGMAIAERQSGAFASAFGLRPADGLSGSP